MPHLPEEPGSARLRNTRHERFAILLSEDRGLTQLEAYCHSAEPPVEPTPGRQVSASRLANTDAVQERVAYLKRQRAESSAAHAAPPITRDALADLMEQTTAALMVAADAASRIGAENVALSLRKTITVHAGRTARTIRRAPAPEKGSPDLPLDDMLARMECSCDG